MLFIEWWILGRLFCWLALLALGIGAIYTVRKAKPVIRLPIQLLGAFAAIVGAGILLFVLPGLYSDHKFSSPVYSPNGRMAVRIDDFSTGGFGSAYSSKSVELFTARGFRSMIVFSGDDVADLHWKSDAELEISHHGKSDLCESTSEVVVRCISK